MDSRSRQMPFHCLHNLRNLKVILINLKNIFIWRCSEPSPNCYFFLVFFKTKLYKNWSCSAIKTEANLTMERRCIGKKMKMKSCDSKRTLMPEWWEIFTIIRFFFFFKKAEETCLSHLHSSERGMMEERRNKFFCFVVFCIAVLCRKCPAAAS